MDASQLCLPFLKRGDFEILAVVHGASGLYILVSTQLALEVGTITHLEWSGGILVGEVDYCRPKGQAFLIGLKS